MGARKPVDEINRLHQIVLVGQSLGLSRPMCAKVAGMSDEALGQWVQTRFKDLRGGFVRGGRAKLDRFCKSKV